MTQNTWPKQDTFWQALGVNVYQENDLWKYKAFLAHKADATSYLQLRCSKCYETADAAFGAGEESCYKELAISRLAALTSQWVRFGLISQSEFDRVSQFFCEIRQEKPSQLHE